MKKQYLKSKPVCKVTFRLAGEAAGSAGSANIVGEFNDWNIGMYHIHTGMVKIP
jgi:hypothetical protein